MPCFMATRQGNSIIFAAGQYTVLRSLHHSISGLLQLTKLTHREIGVCEAHHKLCNYVVLVLSCANCLSLISIGGVTSTSLKTNVALAQLVSDRGV